MYKLTRARYQLAVWADEAGKLLQLPQLVSVFFLTVEAGIAAILPRFCQEWLYRRAIDEGIYLTSEAGILTDFPGFLHGHNGTRGSSIATVMFHHYHPGIVAGL